MEQIIISVGRECGSGGHEIAEKLAAHYNLKLYDRNLLAEIAKEKMLKLEELKKHDEASHNKLLYRTVKGMNSSPEQNIAKLQCAYLKNKAEKGESFVVVGRCAETVFRDKEGLVSIFVVGDEEVKIGRLMKEHDCDEKEALKIMKENDKRRRKYHDTYCKIKWGESKNYDITINACKIGIDESVKILSDFIDAKTKRA